MSSESTSKKSISLEVLNAYFSHVKSLSYYLFDIIDIPKDSQEMNLESSHLLLNDSDTESYRALLSTSYVGIKVEKCGQNQPRFSPVAPMMYMREIIDKAHEKLFLSATRPNNIITSGYQRVSEKGGDAKMNMSRMGITNRFVNTIVTALQAPEWETLLQRIGADAMLHLLTKTSVFVSLPNDCFCQMSGDPLIFIIPPIMEGRPGTVQDRGVERPTKRKLTSESSERPRKRIRLQRSLSSKSGSVLCKGTIRNAAIQPTERRTAVDIAFPRSRLYYARPSRDPNTHHRIVGLPYHHILNRLNPSYHQRSPINPENYVDPSPRKHAGDVRHLAKYVFPLQFGLSNVFSRVVNTRYQPRQLPDFSDRENEIKRLGKCKTPKRLRDIMKLLDKLLWRHGKCGYSRLRDLACQSKVNPRGEKSIDSSIILEMMAEQSFQLRSQASVQDISADSAGISFRAQSMSQVEKHAKLKPRFAEFSCSYVEVYRYAIMVTKAVIPEAFWGCKKNFKVLQKSIKECITSRRYETITLHHVVQGFSTSECDWLIPPGSAVQKQSRISVTDALKRRELLEEFLYWYFDSFLLPLLKTTFYITESSAFRNRVLYFRQDDWEALCAPLVDRLTETTFYEIDKAEAEEILRQRKLGFSFVRLLPKDTGVRPIVNLRRRRSPKNGTFSGPEQSINQILQTTFQILTYEKKRQPELLGASVFGFNDIYTKLKAFKAQLTGNHSPCNLPKLYFVKVDVQACFDTIDQSMLIKILQDLISEDSFMVQKYGQISCVAGKIKRSFIKKAYPDDEHPHFLSYARDLANALRHTIFVDQVNYQFESKRAALKLLEEHITENIVRIGQKYYSQVVGIPQGSVLSTLLCAFFYGDLEKQFFNFTEDPQSTLLRLVDDYLYVTTSLSKARSFLDMMNKGHPEYGCFISRDKTMTNFDYDSQIMNVTEAGQQYFPWCGLLIGMKDLSVLADYTRFFGIRLEDTLTVEKGRRPGVVFTHKMLQLAKARGHIIYYDNELNSERTVYLNVYQSFVITAMRMHQYLVKWGIDINKSGDFIYNTIRQVIRYTYATIRIKCRADVTKARAGKSDVQKAPVLWLGAHAFHTVMSLKADRYAAILLKRLAFDLVLARHRRKIRMLKGVVKDGLAGLKDIQF